MAQEGDQVPAEEGQVCPVRWVSCGDGKGQISALENITGTHLIRCYPSSSEKRGNRKEGAQDRYHINICNNIKYNQSLSLRSTCTYLQSKET